MPTKKSKPRKSTAELVYVPEEENVTPLGFEEVKRWVIENNDNKAAMDWLNKTTYPFTTRYEERQRDRLNY